MHPSTCFFASEYYYDENTSKVIGEGYFDDSIRYAENYGIYSDFDFGENIIELPDFESAYKLFKEREIEFQKGNTNFPRRLCDK